MTKTHKNYALFQRLFSSVALDLISKNSRKFLKKLSKSPLPATGYDLPACHKVKGLGFLLSNLGTDYSDEYRNKVLAELTNHGASEEIINLVKSGQEQGLGCILFEENGCFPEPRRPATTKWDNLPKSISDKRWKELKESLRSMSEMWPLEILANILNPLAVKKPQRKTK